MIATRVNSVAYEAAHVVKTSGGQLYTIHGYNSGPDQFIQIHDVAALPADGAVPVFFFPVEADKAFAFDLGALGETYNAGIVLCNSSAGPAKTTGAADTWFVANFR